jgi:hypothetical protein
MYLTKLNPLLGVILHLGILGLLVGMDLILIWEKGGGGGFGAR